MEFKLKKNNISVFDKMPIALKELEVILTEKCNLSCEHCFRGKTSNKEISEETLNAIFKKFYLVENLGLGGGEISLVPDKIRMLTKSLKQNKTIVHRVNFTSNAVSASNELLDALSELRDYVFSCSQKIRYFIPNEYDLNEPLYSSFSFDDYHLNAMIKQGISLDQIFNNIAKYQNKFSPDSIHCRIDCDVNVFDSGNAKNLDSSITPKKQPFEKSDWTYPYMKQGDTIIVGGLISISCDGEVIPPNIPFSEEKICSYGNIKTDSLSSIFNNMNTKKVSSLRFDIETVNLIKKLSIPNSLWNPFYKKYGKEKYKKFYDLVNKSAKAQKE